MTDRTPEAQAGREAVERMLESTDWLELASFLAHVNQLEQQIAVLTTAAREYRQFLEADVNAWKRIAEQDAALAAAGIQL